MGYTSNRINRKRVSTYRMQASLVYGFFERRAKVLEERITNEKVFMILVKFSLPLILSGILQQLYSWVDAFIVGNVEGENALAAIGATGVIIGFFVMVMTGFTGGLGILFARKYGAAETDRLSAILSTFLFAVGGVFLVLSVAGVALSGAMLRLLNTPAEIFVLSKRYLQLSFIGIPFLAVYNVYFAALRAIGDSKAPFFAILLSSAVNFVLDVLFVAAMGWGVVGAALATTVAQILMTIFIICYAAKKHSMLRFSLSRGRTLVDRKMLREGLRLGIPPMIQSSVNALGNMVLQNFMNGFGTQTVAAITTAYRVDTVALLPVVHMGTAISTMAAQSDGAGDKKRIFRFFKAGTALAAVISVVLTLFVVFMGQYLVSMFGVGEEAALIGGNFFRRFGCFYPIYGLCMAFRGALEGIGDVAYSSVIGIVALISRIIMSYTLVGLWDNMVIAYAEGLSWCVMLLLYFVRFAVKRRELGVQCR